MPFNRNDIYTSSGSVQLFNEWAPYVYKFDTSSFYNWEQDNLPLYDLEDRTYALWEQNGFTTSAGVPGLALTVSADAANTADGQAELLANKNLFTELSACIAAIPKVVRFPILVEVGSFGDIGDLELHNFRIEEGGSIEIINRAFTRMYDASSVSKSITTPTQNASHILPVTVSSLDASNTLSDASCVHISTALLSGVEDPRIENNNCNRLIYPRYSERRAPLAVGIGEEGVNTSLRDEQFRADPYETAVDTSFDNTILTLDTSSLRQSDDSSMVRKVVNVDSLVGGNMYFNTLGKISIKNCDGPIYVRNFFVDGAKNSAAVNKNGIEVNNSQVILENCASVRCKNAGFKFNNAGVTLSRSAFAYRNYTLETASTRASEVGFGFHAINSDVILSSTILSYDSTSVGDNGASGSDCKLISSRNYAGFVLDNSKLTGGVQKTDYTKANTGGVISSELNTGYGFILNNSVVDLKGLIDVYGNDKGIEADNSKFIFENLCVEAQGNEGVISRNSQFIFDSLTTPAALGQAARHQLDMSGNAQHISLQNNSIFGFIKKNSAPTLYGNSRFRDSHGVTSWGNGGVTTRYALPSISVNDASILELIHPSIRVDETANNFISLPSYGRAIKAVNSSKVSLFGTGVGCNFIFGPAGISYQKKMAGLYGSNNSTINLHGPTAMAQFGVDVLVEDNSVLNIEPPKKNNEATLDVSGFDLENGANHTSVELHATRACLVANKNSTINLTDLGAYSTNWNRTANGQAYLGFGADYPIDTFDTSTYTNSGCLQFYPNPQDDTTITNGNLDDLVTGLTGFTEAEMAFPLFGTVNGLNRFFARDAIIGATPDYTKQGQITQGGVAVRATENSVVNVKNVHFPLGTNDSPLDGFFYTASGSLCDKFMIWNIADTSRLNASYLAVSGMHPVDSQYHGPSAFWASSVDGSLAVDAPAFGAPARTPDTGALSVLDTFGAGSSVWAVPSGVDVNTTFDRFYPVSGDLNPETASALAGAGINISGTTTYMIGAGPHASRNQGPFRIYWTPKSSARILQTDLSGYLEGAYPHSGNFSGVIGPAYQIFAQGYNCSAPLSAIVPVGETNASGDFPDLLRLSYDSDGDGVPDQLWTSGFYYCSELLDDNPSQCILDESAARTFANSQNASVGLAGTPVRVTLIRARSDDADNRGSEAYTGDTSGSVGFKSAAIFDLSRDN